MLQEYKFIKEPNFKNISGSFCEELLRTAEGQATSLSFIKTYIPSKPIITSGLIQVIVIGGTNYEIAIVEKNENGDKHIVSLEKGKVPSLSSADIFGAFLNTHLDTKVDGIVLNLGFPISYFRGEKGQPDGMLLKATKEHTFIGVLGHKIGEIVLDRYIRKHNAYAVVAVANDVVCLTQEDIGLIVASGFNMGLQGQDSDGVFRINLEAGNSSAYEPDDVLEAIDKNSSTAGTHRFEKVIAGNYLPLHFNHLAHKHGINKTISQSEELSEIAKSDDRAGELARELFDRSARYVAAHIAGMYQFLEEPEKLTISVEGSLFHYGYKYQKSLKRGLKELGIADKTITFHSSTNSSVVGALSML